MTQVSAAPLRRLTREQYDNTFFSNSISPGSRLSVEYRDSAENLAATAVMNDLDGLTHCTGEKQNASFGKGNSHSFDKVPFVVAGGAGGKLKTGRYLQYNGVEHNRLLVSVAQLMGVADMDKFGSTDTKTGTLSGFL